MATRGSQNFVPGSEESKIYGAVMAMKQAVGVALQHGDIRQDAVCAGIGMSTSELNHWINSKTQSLWDTKVAEWLKRTQGRAMDSSKGGGGGGGGSSSRSSGGGGSSSKSGGGGGGGSSSKSGVGGGGGGGESSSSAKPEPKPKTKLSKAEASAMSKLKQDLIELEDYIPWNAVVPAWGNKRTAWARRTKECESVPAVAKQLNLLEQALVEPALLPEWRNEVHAEWLEELTSESKSEAVLELLREMEDHIR